MNTNRESPDREHQRIVAFGYRLLWLLSRVVPQGERDEWLREWHAELYYSWNLDGRHHRSMVSAYARCLGALEDAIWLRIRRRDRSMLLHDLRYAVRSFSRSAGFTTVVLVTLALGIGANTTIFSMVDAVLLRPLPVAQPSELTDIWTSCRRGFAYCTSSYPDYLDYAERNRSFTDVAAFSNTSLTFSDDGSPRVVDGAMVTGNYFGLLGVPAAHGRPILPSDDQLNAPQAVMVLSHRVWVRQFGRDRDVIGQTLRLNDVPFTVVGVAPRGFRGTRLNAEPQFWIPFTALVHLREDGYERLESRDMRWISGTIGRRLPDVTNEQAQSDLLSVSQRLQEEHPGRDGRTITAEATRTMTLPAADTGADIVRFVALLMGVVSVALLIACANIANLLLARASARRREIGLRLALGAGRRRLMKQLITESVLLSVGGAFLGIVVAHFALQALSGFALPGFVTISSLDLQLDVRVLAFTASIAVLTGILFGLAPAIQATRLDLVSSLKAQSLDRPMGRIMRSRGLLLSIQIALALVLLVGAGLFVRSLRNGLDLDVGFETRSLAMGGFSLARRGYTEAAARQLMQDVTGRLSTHPSVRTVSSAVYPPLAQGGSGFFISIDGYTPAEGEELRIEANWVGANYFETLGIPVLEGRGITEGDGEGTPLVAVVNETMANRWWPDQNPVGRTFRQGSGTEITIVGVARDVKAGLTDPPEPFIHYPMLQHIEFALGRIHLLAATDRSASEVLPALRREVQALDPNLPLEDLQTLQNRFAEYLMPQRMGSVLLSTLGALTVLLAVVGITGVVAFAVNQRRREIGIRMALGGSRGHVLGVMTRGAMIPVAIGTVVGLLTSVGVTRFVTTFMYGVAPTDPATFGMAAGLLGLIALAAAYFPARRATTVNATEALKSE